MRSKIARYTDIEIMREAFTKALTKALYTAKDSR